MCAHCLDLPHRAADFPSLPPRAPPGVPLALDVHKFRKVCHGMSGCSRSRWAALARLQQLRVCSDASLCLMYLLHTAYYQCLKSLEVSSSGRTGGLCNFLRNWPRIWGWSLVMWAMRRLEMRRVADRNYFPSCAATAKSLSKHRQVGSASERRPRRRRAGERPGCRSVPTGTKRERASAPSWHPPARGCLRAASSIKVPARCPHLRDGCS